MYLESATHFIMYLESTTHYTMYMENTKYCIMYLEGNSHYSLNNVTGEHYTYVQCIMYLESTTHYTIYLESILERHCAALLCWKPAMRAMVMGVTSCPEVMACRWTCGVGCRLGSSVICSVGVH